jgi:hypothetical protein
MVGVAGTRVRRGEGSMAKDEPKVASVDVEKRDGDSNLAFLGKVFSGVGIPFVDTGGYDATVTLNDGRVGSASGSSKESAIESAVEAAKNK